MAEIAVRVTPEVVFRAMDTYLITGRGVAVTGMVEKGHVLAGMWLFCGDMHFQVRGVESFGGRQDNRPIGLLSNMPRSTFEAGQLWKSALAEANG